MLFFRSSFVSALLSAACFHAASLVAADLTTWPSQYTVRPWDTSLLTAADVVGPDGIVYPDFTGVGVSGGIPDINDPAIRATYTVFNVLNYGATADGVTNDDTPVAAAASAARAHLAAHPAHKAILHFPAGTYVLSRPIVFTQNQLVIDGDGPDLTILKLATNPSQTGALLSFDKPPAFAGYLTATASLPRGGDTATFNLNPAAQGYTVGTWTRLTPTVSGPGTTISDRVSNPDNHVVYSDAYWQTGRVTWAKVVAVNSAARTVTFDRRFAHDYFADESPQLRRLSMIEHCGVQDLAIETLSATARLDPILFNFAANSWIKNLKTVKARDWPVRVQSSTRIEISDSRFLGTWQALNQGGGIAYFGWTEAVSDCLMDNVEARDLRHMAIFMMSNRTVIRGSTFSGQSIQSPQLHGRFPHENLIEGSTFDTVALGGTSTRGITAYGADGGASLAHGVSGPRNVFYNNRVDSGNGFVRLNGVLEGFIFAYNRVLKTDDTDSDPPIHAMDRTFDAIVRGNIFQSTANAPFIGFSENTCSGWSVTDNRIHGSNGFLYEGDSAPALAHNNRFFPLATAPAAATTPEAPSIYAWQQEYAATPRLVLVIDRRTVADTGGTSEGVVVRVKAYTASDLTVALATDFPGLSVPATVTIPAGAVSAPFTLTGTNRSGEQLVTVTATAPGLLADTEKVAVLDQDLPQPNFGGGKWPAQPPGLPANWKAGNFGQSTATATQDYTAATDTWSLTGGGVGMETFHGSLSRSGRRFVWQTIDGDGEIRARLVAASGDRQVGLMIADDEGTRTDFICVEATGRVWSSSNDAQNGLGNGVPVRRVAGGARTVPVWLRLKRVGSVFTAYRSTLAAPAAENDWTVLATVDLYANTPDPNNAFKSPAVLDRRMHYGFFLNSGSANAAASASFTGTQLTGDIVSTATPPAAPTGLEAFRAAHGLAPDGSDDRANPAGDGVANLLKYAFNLIGSEAGQVSTLSLPNAAMLTPGGVAGLPLVALAPSFPHSLSVTFVRRRATASPAPGITYAVEFSDNLATWGVNPFATETTTVIDADFERVTITDTVSTPARRFARVRVIRP